MVTKNFVKTAIAGLHSWALHRFKKFEITEIELLELLTEMDAIQPLANAEGVIYTNNSGQVYIL